MKELQSKTELGGEVGDTFLGQTVRKVHSDGVYGFVNTPRPMILESSPDVASRPDVANLGEGTSVPVSTNGLTYVVEDGVYTVPRLEITRADEVARDLLSEMEPNQRVYLSAIDRLDRWDGNAWVEGKVTVTVETYDDIPAPDQIDSGVEYIVTNDPDDSLNGTHIALGGLPGQPATHMDQI